jgi:hypothetical protein
VHKDDWTGEQDEQIHNDKEQIQLEGHFSSAIPRVDHLCSHVFGRLVGFIFARYAGSLILRLKQADEVIGLVKGPEWSLASKDTPVWFMAFFAEDFWFLRHFSPHEGPCGSRNCVSAWLKAV